MNNLISVVIPVYNGGRFLKDAIDSVLNQTYKNLEIIVVDDGSTDNTKQIVSAYPTIKYFFQENKGVASARNLAISYCGGEFITFLDSDDILVENKIELQLQCLENNTAVDICISHQENFVEEAFSHFMDDFEHFLTHEKISLMTMFVRKHLFEVVGLFDEKYRHSSDFDWITRAKEMQCKVLILPDVLQKRRLHDANISVKARKENDMIRFKILRESVERRRNAKQL